MNIKYKNILLNFFSIGTDGGGICYGFSIKKNFSFCKCPLGDLDINEISTVVESFKDFIRKALIEEL